MSDLVGDGALALRLELGLGQADFWLGFGLGLINFGLGLVHEVEPV